MATKAKIDWLAARQLYLSDATIGYSEVAKQFGVSKNAVLAKGKVEGGPELRRNLAEKAYENFQKKLLKTKEAAQDRHLVQFQNVQALANRIINDMANTPKDRAIDALELRRTVAALKDAVMGERVVLGLPTNVGALTDPEGNDAFKGLAESYAAAQKVLNAAEKSTAGTTETQ
jgi:hypothetical protein